MEKFKFTPKEGLAALSKQKKPFITLFQHGTMQLEYYKPEKIDLQQPHSRDEVYVVISGTGIFYCAGERKPFKAGDFLFVPAKVEHRFEDFSEDFATWVIFYGPEGGEASGSTHKSLLVYNCSFPPTRR